MLTTLSILSRDQGKLHTRPASEEAWFDQFRPATQPDDQPARRFSLRQLWPLPRRSFPRSQA